MMKRLLAFILLLLSAHQVIAGPCVLDQSTCLDATPCKTIAGKNICLADISETCWKYKDDYTCVKVGAEQQCEPLMDATTGCFQINSKCIATDPVDGSCFTHEMLWQCPDWTMTTPPDVIRLDDTINYVKNALNESTCDGSNTCTTVSQTCIEGAETRTISGIDVYKDCWKWNREYTCSSANSADCLVNESDPTCALTSTVCASLNPDSSCALYSKTYTCSSGTVDTAAANAQCEGGGAPCTTQTVTLPPETRTEACQETMDANPETCDRTRDVQVDKDYLYSCKSSNNQVQTETCNKILTVTVDANACVQGTLLAQYSTYKGDIVRVYCDNSSQVRVTGNFNGWCYWNYSQYQHTAYVSLDQTPVVATKGQVLYYEECSEWDYDGNCISTTPKGPIATMNPAAVSNNVLFGSYYRRGCMVDLQPSTCNADKTKCTFNLRLINQYNWDDSYYPDIDVVFSSGEVFPTVTYVEHDAWTDQCITLDARTQ